MTWLDALIYGAVQGLTEYLPVSSSAHLILLPLFMGQTDPGLAFDVFLHSGTLAATIIYFRKDWCALFSVAPPVSWRFIAFATVPALIVGAAAHKYIETALRGPAVMAVTLALGGMILVAIDRFCKKTRTLSQLTLKDALVIGVVQCLALIPGVSRSGSTIAGGRAMGFTREASARFSFLLSAPVTGAALIFELRKWRELLQPTIGLECLVIGALSSFFFAWLAIDVLLKVVRRYSYLSFAVYRIILAAVIAVKFL